MLESDGSTYNKFMTARQIGAVARQGPGSSSAAPTEALEPFVHRGMYTTESGEVGHYCYIGHYYRTSDGEPTIPLEEGGPGYGGCTEVRWLGRCGMLLQPCVCVTLLSCHARRSGMSLPPAHPPAHPPCIRPAHPPAHILLGTSIMCPVGDERVG